MVRIKEACGWFWFTAQAVLVIVSSSKLTTTTTTTSESSCRIEIAPNHEIAVLDKDNVSVTCTVTDCVDIQGLIITNQNGNHIGLLHCPNNINPDYTTHSYTCTGGPINYTEYNGTFIECYGQMSNASFNVNSTAILLLVQGTIEDVTGLTVRKVDTNLLNISWTPVFAYDGLSTYYNVSLNGTSVQPAAWFEYDTLQLDPCEEYLNISITPFISTTDNILTGSTIYWDDIPTEAPLNDTSLNYTTIIQRNGSVFMIFSIDSCECPPLTSSNLTLQNDTYSFSMTVPVVPNNTCSSTASVALSLYMNLEVDVYLHNIVGSTKQNQTILIDTNPLVSFTVINGTPGVLTVRCNFTNDVIIINKYAMGCMVFYTDMNEPLQSIPRNNNESVVTMNITNISTTGYYDFYVMVLPAPVRSEYSEYISVKPNPPTSTAHQSSSCHSSNSTSITPTPTHTTSFSPSASISSSPSCTPCTTEQRSLYAEFVAIGLILGIIIGILITACICCCINYRQTRRQREYSLQNNNDTNTRDASTDTRDDATDAHDNTNTHNNTSTRDVTNTHDDTNAASTEISNDISGVAIEAEEPTDSTFSQLVVQSGESAPADDIIKQQDSKKAANSLSQQTDEDLNAGEQVEFKDIASDHDYTVVDFEQASSET